MIMGDDPPIPSPQAVNVLEREVPAGIDVSLSTHLVVVPDENFEAAGIALLGIPNVHLSLLVGRCQICLPETAGVGIYVEFYRGDENLGGQLRYPWEGGGNEVTLIMEWSPEAAVAVGYYQYPDGQLRQAFRFENVASFDRFALTAYNLPAPGTTNTAPIEGRFDWFEFRSYS